ncbi:hypothetical protein CSKR_105958 [Clonorchis sinensis]|uniref:PHD-type domain-containing protein n=2 Tax=Clonorchis sinensis TaxID=79923 RepID=A0A8T1MLH7_CLOSI|nr:hypothetical protein CSKR_105958 [Clonorchis sinensis]
MEAESEHDKGVMDKRDCPQTLKQQSEFAALCSFIHHFGADLGIYLTFPQLVQFLSLNSDANWKKWETLHIKLLNKLKYRARPERWEPVLGRFLQIHAHDAEDLLLAGDLLQRGSGNSSTAANRKPVCTPPLAYYDLDFPIRTKMLLLLLETQFDRNQAFKEKVNVRSAVDLRFRPLGTDVWGRNYWLLKDSEVNVLLYREEAEHEKIQLVCETTDEIRQLHHELKDACPPESKLADILVHQCTPSNSLLETIATTLLHNGLATTESEQLDSASSVMDQEVKPFPPSPSTPPPTPIPAVTNGPAAPVKSSNLLIKTEDTELCTKVSPPSSESPVGEKAEENPLDNIHSVKADPQPPGEDESTADGKVINGECTQPAENTKKCQPNKRTAKVKPNGNDSTEVRRSGRQRKPVEFLTMETLQPKRSRSSATVTKPQEVHTKEGNKHVSSKHSRMRGSKSKLLEVPGDIGTASSNYNNESKQRRKKKKRRRRRKGGSRSNPWLCSSSSSESFDEDNTFEHALQQQFAESSDSDARRAKKANSASDWNDKPESDFNPDDIGSDSDADSLTQGRNLARQKRLQRKLSSIGAGQLVPEQESPCQVCFRCHLPEWMLLCDRCDLGHHAMCLRPPLLIIPEGDWFCPRCQHATLVSALAECADAVDAEQKKQTLFKRMQERLNYVNISMTNILAEEDDGSVDKVSRTRNRSRQNIIYRESDSSDRLSEDPSSGAESFTASDEQDHSEGNRRVRGVKPRTRFPRTARNRRAVRLDSSSESEVMTYSSSSDSSTESPPVPAPRSTRKRQAHYNLSEAFKHLDEVLEEDEKYQQEKLLRKSRKTNASDASGDEAGVQEPAERPGGRSRGKDLSNILGPDWKDWEPSKPRSRRRRLGGQLSSSSDESELDGKSHRASGDDDTDFKPPSGVSSEVSELEGEEFGSSGATSSDNSWLCASRRARKKRSRSVRSSRHQNRLRKRRRPIPQFEESENEASGDVLHRPKRNRTVVSYRESDEQDEDDPPLQKLRTKVRRGFSDDDEKSSNDNLSRGSADRDSVHVSNTPRVERKNRRRILSSSESEYRPEDEMTGNESPTEQKYPADSASDLSGELSHTKLKISESSPEQSTVFEQSVSEAPVVTSAIPPVSLASPCFDLKHDSHKWQSQSDEESVLDETDDLLPSRPFSHSISPKRDIESFKAKDSPDIFD